MRNKSRIAALETQVSELTEQVAMLLEVMTRPERASEMPKGTLNNYRQKPRRAVNTANRMKPWTDEDIKLAMTMRDKGASNRSIAKVLGRSERGVGAMFTRYGLVS